MQELFVDKTNFFKFLFISDKAGLDQLNIITATRSACLSESFHPYPWLTGKGKSHVLKTCTKSHQLNRHINFFYFIASLVFHKLLCVSYRNGLNRSTLKLRHSKYLKKYELCRFDTFCMVFAFYYLL